MSARPVLLIVEDDPDLLQGWTELFEFAGHDVRSHLSATDALSSPGDITAADVLITDYYLSDTNGLGLIRRVRAIKPELPAVVLTGLKQDHAFESIRDDENITLFYKPIAIADLEAHVDALIAG